jgi:succinate-semialdehyde dehydrogenase/glutarate-semialdehyde dehydrogenase
VSRFHDAVLAHHELLLDVVQHETGKSRSSAFDEVADIGLTAQYYAKSARRHLKPAKRQGAFPLLTRTREYYWPKGVVGMITPWNYPLTLPITDALPALLAGNAIVLKPDAQTPLSSLAAIDLLYQAGLPRGLFQVVLGDGPTVGGAIIDNADFVMFTGSTATGKKVAQACGERLIGFAAELGGKNPMIVLDDAPFDRALQGTIPGELLELGPTLHGH